MFLLSLTTTNVGSEDSINKTPLAFSYRGMAAEQCKKIETIAHSTTISQLHINLKLLFLSSHICKLSNSIFANSWLQLM